MRLQDKVAIITGSGRGIGKAIALAFAREGASLVLASRTQSELAKVNSQVQDLGVPSLVVPTDVEDPRQIYTLVEQSLKSYERIDILVNNAGIAFSSSVLETQLKHWDRLMNTNLRSVFVACQAVLPHMINQKQGKIINIAAGSGFVPSLNFAAYSASKAAVIMFTECMALEMKPFNIDVNALSAGRTHTQMADDLIAEKGLTDAKPELMMMPSDIAPVAVFLASEESRSVTGANVIARKNFKPGFYGPGNLPPSAY